ncbi:leucine-rich repeat, immunoglobulin-like domain and transmembrane domain-containing protein 1b [Trichomycterus rosablanca]|uniref:leucine-rich repeat, immunoglobulin-like domain and transmembrane domain-containing protein 1b n=1 Tax=Trichomycterus rosablanca TaxID=2290929 RepID=UPI002F35E632
MLGRLEVGLCLTFVSCLPVLSLTCPALCSCFYHKLSGGSKARSVLCNDPDLTSVPTSFPFDTSKLRIEKTPITQISSEAFTSLSSLEFLWMSFNSLSLLHSDSFRGLSDLIELRLEGNLITSFPWESLSDMSSLRLLDLHNNEIFSIPAEAATFIQNLSYLDLSSNNLATLPPEVLTLWFAPKPPTVAENSKIILGLHENPWQCDCRLFDLVQFQTSPSSTSALIDTGLRCSEPESLSGVFFSDVELQRCQVPRVHTAVAKVRSSVGNDVLLRCGTVGVPTPELAWSRADGKTVNGTVLQEVSNEGITWSILSLPNVSYHDSGKYVCRAANFVGSTTAVISLVITDAWQVGETSVKKTSGRKNGDTGRAAYQDKLVAQNVPPSSSSVGVPVSELLNGSSSTRMSPIASSRLGPASIRRQLSGPRGILMTSARSHTAIFATLDL